MANKVVKYWQPEQVAGNIFFQELATHNTVKVCLFLSEFTLPSSQAEFLMGPAGGSEFLFVNPLFSL